MLKTVLFIIIITLHILWCTLVVGIHTPWRKWYDVIITMGTFTVATGFSLLLYILVYG